VSQFARNVINIEVTMSNANLYHEDLISQIPALQLLINLGYEYLSPYTALSKRGEKMSNVILEDVLLDWLQKHNNISYKERAYAFSNANIQEAVRRLKDEPYDGLVRTNEKIYELLTLGTSLQQTIEGDTRSFTLNYIDWKTPENNIFQVSDEFEVEKRRSSETRRPDIVLFVNGIPLVVIECKRPDLEKGGEKAVNEAITQMIRNQKDDEIPNLFIYSQIVLGLSKNDALYATTGTPKKFWAVWHEERDIEKEVHRLINKPLSEDQKNKICSNRDNTYLINQFFKDTEQAGARLSTSQDLTLYSLLKPERLIELIFQFIIYDAGVKKIARYQQYFAIKETIDRVAHLNSEGERTGGVIWHTTGSGKSLTMVMLAKALALHPNIKNPRVILVTDRVNLDSQIWNTFKACGKKPERAESGHDLVKLITESNADIITTVINKFETVAKDKVMVDNPNIFVLVDEGHRTQYGSIHAKMRQVFTKACYIGFTGTPLLKKEKSTAEKFGGLIHPYSMRKAIEDKAVVPLLYEGRMAELDVRQSAIDQWFERVTRNLTEGQKRDLKEKFSRAEEVNQADQRIMQIAYDISNHYLENFQGTGLKGQLATSSKDVALKYKRYLDEFGLVTSEVVISAPDTREGNEEVDNTKDPEIEAFWKKMMERFGSEDKYNDELIAQFAREDGFEILIVVDKLLVGFDEPRNTVLYIDKPLKEHAVLQAIARVNRLFDETKEFGYIIDYYGVLGELNRAIQTYDALAGFDTADIAGSFTDTSIELAKLPQRHSDLWAVFASVTNKKDTEALERFLEPDDTRQQFYDALTAYTSNMQVALATVDFYTKIPEKQASTYKDDLRFFHNLRASVKQRYAEVVDYKDYEKKIRKLIDSHIQSTEVKPITELVSIFDKELFAKEVEKIEGSVAKADTIAYRVKQTITEKLEQDPVFYKRFSILIDETIESYKQGRINELQYLEKVNDAMDAIRKGRDVTSIPPELLHRKHAAAYYGIANEVLVEYFDESEKNKLSEVSKEIALHADDIIERNKIRDWVNNAYVHNQMKGAIEDYILDEVCLDYGLQIKNDDLDEILDRTIEVARKRSILN
jgi:type I restriction enzyme, R subunit